MQRLLFIPLLAALSTLASASYVCRPNDICGCGRGVYDSRELVCPRISAQQPDATLKLMVVPGQSSTLQCRDAQEVQYEWLAGNTIGQVKRFIIDGCPLPSVPLGEFMSILGVTGATKLVLFGKHINDTLSRQSLQGLGTIKDLQIYNLGELALPDGLFNDMVNLTILDLRNNAISLPVNVFDHLKILKRLELVNANLTYLKPGVFQSLSNLQMLNLWGNTICNLSRETFSGLSSLMSLGLNTNSISSLPADVFADLGNLKNLSLYGNNFTSLPQGLFAGTPLLELLRLNSNRKTLATLPDGMLANLTALREVYLYDCNISQLPENLLWESSNISTLQLSTNSIRSLPDLLFRDANNLKELDISHNKLTTLPDYVFTSLRELQVLHLDYNHLTTMTEAMLQGLANLKQLYLNNNALRHIDADTFRSTRNLLELYMSQNHITFNNKSAAFQYEDGFGLWSPIQHCTNLEVLHLANNSISELYADWRNTLSKLRQLDLRYNSIQLLEIGDIHFVSNNLTVDLGHNLIKTINLKFAELVAIAQDNVPPGYVHNVTIKLDGNPLQCDCNIYHFLKYLDDRLHPKVRQIMDLVPDKLVCAAPPERAGVPVTQLHAHTLTCRTNASVRNCPALCSCSLRPEDKVLIVDCNSVGLSEAPSSLPDTNNIELILDNNFLRALPETLQKGYANVSKLSLSYNNITWLGNESLPRNLKELYLDHNNMTHINSSVLETWTNKTNLTLHGNPWICDCDALDFFNFLQTNFKQVAFLNNVTCRDGQSLARMTAKDICPFFSSMVVALSAMVAVVGVAVGILVALYFRYQSEVKVWLYAHSMCLWFVTEEELDKNKTYDAFVSYSHKDEDFVSNKLLPGLENGPRRFKLCVHYRDWIAGEFITTQIIRSVQESRRTLVVLSPDFINSEWGRLEFRAAHKQALSEGRARVIVVLFGDIGPMDDLDTELRAYLSTNTYVKWGDPWFWDKLRYALPHPPKMRRGVIPSRTGSQFRNPMDDKLELINPSTPPAVTTPPAEVALNPLEVSNGYINHGCAKILLETTGSVNGAVKCV